MILHPTRSEGGREGTETVSLVHVSESPGWTSGCSTLVISLAIDLDFLVLWKITLCKKRPVNCVHGSNGVTQHRAPYPEDRASCGLWQHPYSTAPKLHVEYLKLINFLNFIHSPSNPVQLSDLIELCPSVLLCAPLRWHNFAFDHLRLMKVSEVST